MGRLLRAGGRPRELLRRFSDLGGFLEFYGIAAASARGVRAARWQDAAGTRTMREKITPWRSSGLYQEEIASLEELYLPGKDLPARKVFLSSTTSF